MKTKKKTTKKKSKKKAAARAWPLRLEWIEAGTIKRNPDNWARHPNRQTEAMRAALEQIGWAGAVLYNEKTGKLIDGHLRLDVVDPATAVPVLIGNWTPVQERKLILSINPIAGMAGADVEDLERLLDGVELTGGLKYVADELHDLLKTTERTLRSRVDTEKPPVLAWALISIPTVRWGEISADVERMSRVDGVTCETAIGDA